MSLWLEFCRKSLLDTRFPTFGRQVQILPPQPTMRTDLDIGARNPVTTTVTGFFYPIFSSETQ